MRDQKRPHPATVQRRQSSFGGAKVPPPHPATVPRFVVQPKVARERPPHPATVVRAKPALEGISARLPHPATVVQSKQEPLGRRPRLERLTTVVQAMEVKDPKKESETTFKTLGGTFTVNSYEDYKDGSAVGAVIDLKFEPNLRGDCRVGLVQTVKETSTLKISGKTVFGIINSSIADEEHGIEIDIPRFDDGRTNPTVSNSPVYGQLQKPYGPLDLASVPDPICHSKDTTKPGNRIARVVAGKLEQPATMWDRARRPLKDLNACSKVEITFEVAALVLSGDLAKQYMGSIGWGWTWTPDGLKLKPIQIIGSQLPSPEFFLAAEAWNHGYFEAQVTQDVDPSSEEHKQVDLELVKELRGLGVFDPVLLGLSSSGLVKARPKPKTYHTVQLPIRRADQVLPPAASSSSSPAISAVATSLSSSPTRLVQ